MKTISAVNNVYSFKVIEGEIRPMSGKVRDITLIKGLNNNIIPIYSITNIGLRKEEEIFNTYEECLYYINSLK